MKLNSDLTINGKRYTKGSYISPFKVYPFFLIHMAMFGGSGFFLAYFADDVDTLFLYIHGGIAILIYTIFYIAMFGVDEVKWMFINSLLGLFGIYCEINIILSFIGKELSNYPAYVHVIPFLYYVLYTFLLRQSVLDIFGVRDNPQKKKRVEWGYIAISVVVYTWLYFRY